MTWRSQHLMTDDYRTTSEQLPTFIASTLFNTLQLLLLQNKQCRCKLSTSMLYWTRQHLMTDDYMVSCEKLPTFKHSILTNTLQQIHIQEITQNWPKIFVKHVLKVFPVYMYIWWRTEGVSHKLFTPKLPPHIQGDLASNSAEWVNWNFFLELAGLHVVATY